MTTAENKAARLKLSKLKDQLVENYVVTDEIAGAEHVKTHMLRAISEINKLTEYYEEDNRQRGE